jgi:hypothetical protein
MFPSGRMLPEAGFILGDSVGVKADHETAPRIAGSVHMSMTLHDFVLMLKFL